MAPDKLKVLLFDIESAPLLAYIWAPSDDYVTHDRLIHDSFMLCWSAKWYEDKHIHSALVTPDEAKTQDDTRIVQALADLIREADVIVGHNANNFDIPVLNNRLLILGLEPIGPTRSIDTLKLARKHLRLAYRKLDYLGEVLGLGRKLRTDFELWKNCYHGNRKALNQMLKYNKRDTILLEGVYKALLPYVNGTPRLVLPEYVGQFACPHCGSANIMKRGTYHTNVSTFQRFHCGACLKYSRSRAADKAHFAVAPL